MSMLSSKAAVVAAVAARFASHFTDGRYGEDFAEALVGAFDDIGCNLYRPDAPLTGTGAAAPAPAVAAAPQAAPTDTAGNAQPAGANVQSTAADPAAAPAEAAPAQAAPAPQATEQT